MQSRSRSPKRSVPGVARRIAARLATELKPRKIILFGSHAYGSPHPDSDLDLLIISQTEKPFYDRIVEVRRLVQDVRKGVPMDVLVFTPTEVEERLAEGNPFLHEILTKGKVLYGG